MNPAPARLFLSPGATLFLGPVAQAARHRHHAAQISLGLQAPVQIDTGDGPRPARYARIPANQMHAFDGGGHLQLVILLDGQSPAGTAVSAGGIQLFQTLPPGRPALPSDITSAREMLGWALDGIATPVAAPTDPRIARVLAHLRDPRDRAVDAQALAGLAALSKSRFLALFRAQTGLPLRRYILWRRILAAVQAASRGADLTHAAHRGGFADSAHFSRVFRENFGLQPSLVLKNSQFVQVTVDLASQIYPDEGEI